MQLARRMPESDQATYSNQRVKRLKSVVQAATPGVCAERALIWTDYHRDPDNRDKNVNVQIAEALTQVLLKKSIAIHPDELIVGNYCSRRVGGSPHPELSGVMPILEIFGIDRRQVNPLEISRDDKVRLFKILPFWLRHGIMLKAYNYSPLKLVSFMISQFRGYTHVVNEMGGISHVAPDYEKLMAVGADGIAREASERQADFIRGTDQWHFLESVKIISEGLARFGERYAWLAEDMARQERDQARKNELAEIARVCRTVPRKGATSFREALQSLAFGQIGVILEGLDNSACPGRMDQYLYPYYKKDVEAGVLTREEAKELLACFTIKANELVPVFSKFVTRFYGGLTNFQSVIVGGVGRDGNDATNELSYVFVELMDELRMKQPNYQARIHAGSPPEFVDRIYDALAGGASSPALYNDDVIVKTLVDHGYAIEDARDYAAIGCVEPAAQGKSFSSTDAGVFNGPAMVEMALNEGRRLGERFRIGAKTPPVESMRSMEDVKAAFETQLTERLAVFIADLKEAELLNARFHPTPLTSMLLDGCVRSGTCSTRGGAAYNFSGVQIVGAADAGDALAAIERLVFKDRKFTLAELVRHLENDLADERARALMLSAPKFGNDDPEADAWTLYVIDTYLKALKAHGQNTRGGDYVAGIYSVTTHKGFGEGTGAMAHGRRAGEPFAAGIAPVNGMDKKGPTALINSLNLIDFTRMANGINFNVKFDAGMINRRDGRRAIQDLMSVYFKRGGMQSQVNVIDTATLKQARANPEAYSNLLVRVSGYSAYFTDLSPAMQDDVIERTSIGVG